jgi:hypothetical protein
MFNRVRRHIADTKTARKKAEQHMQTERRPIAGKAFRMYRITPHAMGAMLLVFLTCAAVENTAGAAPEPELTPPPGATPVREVQAGGAQVYACRAAADGTYQWTLTGPKALLVNDDGSDFGTHGAGPSWTAADGSTIRADGAHPLAVVKRTGAVPALMLKVVSSNGSGLLTGVQYVRRADTEGGVAPARGCDAAHAGATTAVHYSAVYTFFR